MALKNYTLGIDVGGSFIKFGLIDKKYKIVKFWQTPSPKDKKSFLVLLLNNIKAHRKMINKIGIGIPGTINRKTGQIIKTRNFSLTGVKLDQIIRRSANLPVRVDNDASCFVLAEALIGSGKKHKIVAGLTLGTGVGGGLVINKKLFVGQGNAGGFGDQVIDLNKPKDLEQFAGARDLGLEGKDFVRLAALALKNNRKAVTFWKRMGSALGYGCLNITKIIDPEIIILGGKTAQYLNLFRPELIRVLKKYNSRAIPKIIKSKLIDRAGVIGAALLFK